MSKNLSELAGRKGLQENLFEQIGRSSKDTGTVSRDRMAKLSKEFLVGKANVYGTASFYDFTRESNTGKKIYVCNGSACLTADTQSKVRSTLKQHFSEEEIGEMCCLGRCYENSSFHYNGHNYSGNDLNRLDAIINDEIVSSRSYYSASFGTHVLINEPQEIGHFAEIIRTALSKTPEQLLEELGISNLRGRGGAGFPAAIKMKTCKDAPGDQKFVVCNADEGDPAAYSDRHLLEQNPYSVLTGMVIAGYIIGADSGVVYIRAEYPESIEAIRTALDEMAKRNLWGESVLGTNFNYTFKVIAAQGAYICGEETALLNSIEGQRPEVRTRPPFPATHGLFNKPTLVNNVETLAAIPWIIHHGGEQYAAIGKGKSTGTKLLSLDGYFNRPGIYEVDMGTPLRRVIDELGQGFRVPVKALHIGGPLGGLVPVSKIDDLTIDFESFSQNGFLLGHGSILCLPEDYPLVHYLEHLFEFTAHESCGKCFPCRLGSVRGKELFHKAQHEDYKIESELLNDLLETMQIGSLCALGGGVPLPIQNALQYFKAELEPYLAKN
jgi:NADH-quinone oxidoreductase subunit F